MKKIILLFFFLSSIAPNGYSQMQWSWVNSQSGSASQIGAPKVVAGANGNFYLTGSFDGTRMFGTYALTSIGNSDAFIARYDNQGNCLWANSYGVPKPNASTFSNAVAVDGNGDVYIAGTFTDTMVVSGITLYPYGIVDMFLIKLNQSGNVIWAKSFGGGSADHASALAIDPQNNIYLSGTFFWKCYFGPNDSIGNNTPNDQIFITRINPGGQVEWVVEAGGNQSDQCAGISFSNNSLSLTGTIAGTCIFGSHTVTTVNSDAFIAGYDTAGNNNWVKVISGPISDFGAGVSKDSYGNSYVTGLCMQGVSFGSGVTLSCGNFLQVFIAKYNATGVCQWAKKGGNPGVPTNGIGGISTDINGYSVITGTFEGSATFGTFTIPSSGTQDAFIVKYSPSGNCQYFLKGGGVGQDNGYSCTWLPTNEFIVAGTYKNTANFGSISVNTPAATTYAIYLGLLPGFYTGIDNIIPSSAGFAYPNPAVNSITIANDYLKDGTKVSLINSIGQTLFTETNFNKSGDLIIDTGGFPSGIYTVMITSESSSVCSKVQISK
ncbi:MAG: T9SS type A sorting domain-containing protein [Bacteroidia bacterium]